MKHMSDRMTNTHRNPLAIILLSAGITVSFSSCTDHVQPVVSHPEPADSDRLYILNEGQMGMNNASIDFYSFDDGTYFTDAFTAANPDVALGLGDTGNDIAVHDGKLWAVLNGSGIVEVMDAYTMDHIASIAVPGCRDIAFGGDYAYVTSWAGAYYGGEDRLGAVYRLDTGTLKVKDRTDAGYQPEGIAVADGKIYVANSGGIAGSSGGSYDNRLIVMDEASFTAEKEVQVADNIQDIVADGNGKLWISSPGDYSTVHSGIYVYDPETGLVTVPGASEDAEDSGGTGNAGGIRVSSMTYSDGKLWVLGNENEWDFTPGSGQYILYTVDCATMQVSEHRLQETGAAAAKVPYGVWVSSGTRIFIADAGDYINPGTVYMLDSGLGLMQSFSAGVIPGHFALFSPGSAGE